MTRRVNRWFLWIGAAALGTFMVAGFSALFTYRDGGRLHEWFVLATIASVFCGVPLGIGLGAFPNFYTYVIRTWRRRAGELGPIRQAQTRMMARVFIGLGMTVHEGGATKWEPLQDWPPPKPSRWHDAV